MIELVRDPIAGGIVVALAFYGFVLAWALLSHMGWLPRPLASAAWAVGKRLEKRRFAGRLAALLRRRPLLAGLFISMALGAAFAFLVGPGFSMVGVVVIFGVFYLVVRYLDIEPVDWEDEPDTSSHPNPYGLYFSNTTDEIVLGSDPKADVDRPFL